MELATRTRTRDRLLARAETTPRPSIAPAGPSIRHLIERSARTRYARVGAVAGGAVAGWALAGPPLALCGALAAGVVPSAVARARERRGVEALEEQLADATASIAAALRSGLSLH